MYLTPALYRTMGYGVDLSGTGDTELDRQLRVASQLVNRFCNRPTGYDFRGGSVIGEVHRWDVSNGYAPGTQRLWPFCTPVKAVSSFKIQVTNTQYLDVSTGYIFVGPGYLEPVIASTSIGVWSYGAIPVAGFSVPQAVINYTYGYDFAVTGEPLEPDGGTTYRAANQWWTADAPTVYVNDVVLDDDEYAYDQNEGTVTLDTPIDFDDVVTADYHHRVPSDVRDATAMVVTQLLGQSAIAAAGMQGLSGISVEEVEIRQSRDSAAMRAEISGLAASLLMPYRQMVFG